MLRQVSEWSTHPLMDVDLSVADPFDVCPPGGVICAAPLLFRTALAATSDACGCRPELLSVRKKLAGDDPAFQRILELTLEGRRPNRPSGPNTYVRTSVRAPHVRASHGRAWITED